MYVFYPLNFSLVTQQSAPPNQNVEQNDPLGHLLNEETAMKTTADENEPPRSILAQLIDLLPDEEFVGFLGLAGCVVEELDK